MPFFYWVFECDLAYRKSVSVLRMLYKIMCNPLHPLYGALPVPYVPVRVTRSALIAHRVTYAPPRCRTSLYNKTFILFSVSLWNDLIVSPYSMVWDWRVSRAGPISLYWPSCSLPFCLLLFSLSLLSFYGLLLGGWGLRTDRVLIALSQPCLTNLFLIIIITIIQQWCSACCLTMNKHNQGIQ